MAISKKGKRKLVYNDQIYYWHIIDGFDIGPVVQILSEDKKLVLNFTIEHNSSIDIMQDDHCGCRREFIFSLDNAESITPKSIVLILEAYQKEIEKQKTNS